MSDKLVIYWSQRAFLKKGLTYALALVGAVAFAGPADGNPGQTGRPSDVLLAQATTAVAPAAKSAASQQADLQALEKAAKAEGEVVFYAPTPEASVARTIKAFSSKYGVKVKYINLTNSPLLQRYAAEADAGAFAADFVIISCCNSFIDDGVRKGWFEAISAAKLPALQSGEFPAKFTRSMGAVIQVAPWSIGYHTDKVKGADIFKNWPDMLNKKWQGQVLLADPRSSAAYLEIYSMLIDKYGESFLSDMRNLGGNAPKYPNGIQAMQGMAAGEGAVHFPIIPSMVQGLKGKGAPVERITPDFTTGLEYQLLLTARGKAKNPAAARLFVNYLMSREGNKVFNDEPGTVGIYDTTNLPKDFQAPNPALADKRKEQIAKLLGFE